MMFGTTKILAERSIRLGVNTSDEKICEELNKNTIKKSINQNYVSSVNYCIVPTTKCS